MFYGQGLAEIKHQDSEAMFLVTNHLNSASVGCFIICAASLESFITRVGSSFERCLKGTKFFVLQCSVVY